MKLSAVQSYAAAQIMAHVTLSTFGAPHLSSLENDPATEKALISARIREPGVLIEIGEPGGTSIADLHPGGYHKLQADFDVFVAERISSPTHEPRGLALIELVVAAITGGRQPVQWTGHISALSEHGYSLHILSFNAPVTITK